MVFSDTATTEINARVSIILRFGLKIRLTLSIALDLEKHARYEAHQIDRMRGPYDIQDTPGLLFIDKP